jgi:hypothetical protein
VGHSREIDNSSFERVEEFVYLVTTLTNQNSIQEEIKNRSKPGNACYHSVHNLLCSSSLSKNVNIKLYRSMIFLVVWSLTLEVEYRLGVFENRVLRRMLGPKRVKVIGEWRKPHNEELNDLYCSLNIVRVIKSRKVRWAGHVARMD